MAKWLELCTAADAPAEGELRAVQAGDQEICLVRINGVLRALDNLCPHRQGPLAEGWIENGEVICPWHSWAFSPETGAASYPEGEKVAVFPVRLVEGNVLVEQPEPEESDALDSSQS